MFNKLKTGLVALGATVLGSVSAMADEAETITLVAPSLDWATFASSLMSYLTSAIVVAVGVGLGIWAFRMVYRMFKSFSR